MSAPTDPLSSSNIWTDLSTITPPPSPPWHAVPEPNSQNHHNEIPKKQHEKQIQSEGSIVNVPTCPPESPPSSLPQAIPQAEAHQVDLELRHGFTKVSQLSETEIPTVKIECPTPDDAPLSTWQTFTSTAVGSNSPAILGVPHHPDDRAQGTASRVPGGKTLRPHELMSGGRPTPIYGPFTSPKTNCPQGYRPPLRRDPEYLTLQDCWFCPEKEVSRRVLRREQAARAQKFNSQRFNGPTMHRESTNKIALDRPVKEKKHIQADDIAGHTNSTLATNDTQAPLPNQENVQDTAPNGVGRQTQNKKLSRAVQSVAAPIAALYKYVSSGVHTYIRQRDAHAGELGSHNTETAYWLQHTMLESPETLKSRDYRDTSIPHFIEREVWWNGIE